MNIFLYHFYIIILYFCERQKCLPLKKKRTSNLIFTFPLLRRDKGAFFCICTLEIHLKMNCLVRACKSKKYKSERASDVGAGY